MRVVVVETGDIGKPLTTGVFKTLADLFIDLFKRFDAIRRKGRCNDGDVFLAGLRRFIAGVGLQVGPSTLRITLVRPRRVKSSDRGTDEG